jgi:hypothetical protein
VRRVLAERWRTETAAVPDGRPALVSTWGLFLVAVRIAPFED